VEVIITSVGMSVQDTALTMFIILPSSNECKGLFNTRAFYCSERIFIVNKILYCVTGFDIIQALSSRTIVVISQDLDLTLLYADWTCQEINSLTHSHLIVLSLFL
jgi:hypothetical protein